MAYVITKACLGTKDRSCVEVCPVDCFYDIRKKKYNDKYGVEAPVITWDDSGSSDDDTGNEKRDWGMLVIHPDECINCGACETECPEEAIYEDSSVPAEMKEFIGYAEEETSTMSDTQLDKTRCTAKPAR